MHVGVTGQLQSVPTALFAGVCCASFSWRGTAWRREWCSTSGDRWLTRASWSTGSPKRARRCVCVFCVCFVFIKLCFPVLFAVLVGFGLQVALLEVDLWYGPNDVRASHLRQMRLIRSFPRDDLALSEQIYSWYVLYVMICMMYMMCMMCMIWGSVWSVWSTVHVAGREPYKSAWNFTISLVGPVGYVLHRSCTVHHNGRLGYTIDDLDDV